MLFFTGRLGRPHLVTLAFEVVFSSAKAFYFALEGTPQPFSPCALVWFGLAPPRVKAFCWLASARKVSTIDNLRKRGFNFDSILDMCMMRKRGQESFDHPFIHCEVASQLW